MFEKNIKNEISPYKSFTLKYTNCKQTAFQTEKDRTVNCAIKFEIKKSFVLVYVCKTVR